jgi:hypothetical protein
MAVFKMSVGNSRAQECSARELFKMNINNTDNIEPD